MKRILPILSLLILAASSPAPASSPCPLQAASPSHAAQSAGKAPSARESSKAAPAASSQAGSKAAAAPSAVQCSEQGEEGRPSLISFVEPRIGTAHNQTPAAGLFGKGTEELGQTLPAVLEPNGMNFWTPQTRDSEQKCIAPYYYTDSLFQGFRNSHWIVGGCTQDYGSMTLAPLFGKLRTLPEVRATRFDHNDEISRPDYYSVTLPDEGITAEMTATSRAAIFRFTYTSTGDAYLVVNPNSDEGQGYLEIDLQNRQIRGYNPVHRIYQGWGEPAGFSGWFVVEWQDTLPIASYGTYCGTDIFEGEDKISSAPAIGAYLAFKVKKGETVTIKAASSFTGIDGALANLRAEIPAWDFPATRARLASLWESRLSRLQVSPASCGEALTKFYSALYRASFLPRAFSDADGSYPPFAAGKAASAKSAPGPAEPPVPGQQGPVRGAISQQAPARRAVCQQAPAKSPRPYYDDFSMWDTYRALHPLLNIIAPSLSADMMQSLVTKYEQGGWLPIFPCWNSYTAAMIGDHCIAAIADAYIKGIRNFDIEKAYEGMRRNAFTIPSDPSQYRDGMGRRALPSYLRYGYIPVEDSVPDAFHKREQVSRTLEYAYDDFALAQVARALGKDDDYRELMRRAANWKNVIDPATGYAAPRDSSGSFLPSDPFSFSPYITEGAPCHYTWYVPHDQPALIDMLGGPEAYTAKLDSMFTQRRYWHGNEPCHQVAWLFPYAGEHSKTARYVRHIMDTEYLNIPGGLSGNDDAGQMSAWYIFAALGFYPVCPGSDEYVIGSPSFPRAEIKLENGKTFTIIADGASPENIYVKSMTLNGKPLSRPFLRHSDITSGSTLRLEMTSHEN